MKREGRLHPENRVEWKENLNEKVYNSVIAKRFRRFINWLYSLLINGFFAKIFTAYSAEEELFMNSRFMQALGKENRKNGIATKVKLSMARTFEQSRILTSLGALTASLIHRKLKTYGAFLLSLGAYGTVTYLVREYVLARGNGKVSDLVTCIILLLMAFPLMMSKETLASALLKSRLLRAFLFDGLGLPKDHFTRTESFPKRYSAVTAAGMILGALTYFISPSYYVYAAVLLIAVALVLSYPELGVLAMIGLVPMASLFARPSLILLASVLVTLVSYFVKLIRGKRVFRLGLVDFAVLIFAVILLLGGVGSAGGLESMKSAVLSATLLIGYFLAVNLIRTREWVQRCLVAFLLCASVSGLIGFVQIFTGSLETSWLDTEMFSNISVRITSTFDNPNVYATYLLLAIPFALAFMIEKSDKSKTLRVLCFLLLAICMVETWSRGAWLGILIALVLFFLVYTRRSVAYLMLGGALLPLASIAIPDSVISRFLSIGSASDSSATYRISAWRGVGRMLRENWFGGIGVGEAAFSAVYPAFSYAGIQAIRHTHNLYLQILSETGVVGLIVFLLIVILFMQNCFEYMYRMRKGTENGIVVAGLASVVAVLIMGLTDYVWYNYRVFLMFWIVIGIVNAYIRIGNEEKHRYAVYESSSRYAVNFDFNVDNL